MLMMKLTGNDESFFINPTELQWIDYDNVIFIRDGEEVKIKETRETIARMFAIATATHDCSTAGEKAARNRGWVEAADVADWEGK